MRIALLRDSAYRICSLMGCDLERGGLPSIKRWENPTRRDLTKSSLLGLAAHASCCLQTVERRLDRAGYETTTVANCRDSLDKGGFDPVLMDMRLPDGAGNDLIERMGSPEHGPQF